MYTQCVSLVPQLSLVLLSCNKSYSGRISKFEVSSAMISRQIMKLGEFIETHCIFLSNFKPKFGRFCRNCYFSKKIPKIWKPFNFLLCPDSLSILSKKQLSGLVGT